LQHLDRLGLLTGQLAQLFPLRTHELARHPWPRSIRSCLTQFRSPSALTPISRATSVTVFPEEWTSATASRLNSSEYRLPRLLLLPTWHYFLWNLTSQCPGVHHQGEGSSGLPPIRLHDLRHGAATLMLAADIDIKIVSDTLGHSDTRITRDIYQSVLPHVGKSAAEATAKLVPLQRKAEQEEQIRKAAKVAKKAEKAKAKRKTKVKAKKVGKKG